MLTDYISAAMKRAKYEIAEDGTYYGEIPECPGVWANTDALEACRTELQEVLESWLILKLQDGDTDIPEIDGIRIQRASAVS
ncbi:MAG: type II toxin-antitoxin system HicB family antitoxin [Chloroflexota bacterium]